MRRRGWSCQRRPPTVWRGREGIGANLANWLSVSFYVLGMGLGGAVLLLAFLSNSARWSAAIEPAAEKLTFLLPVGALGLAVVLIAFPSLYPWARPGATDPFASSFQAFWLGRTFFLMRSLAYLVVWLALAFLLVHARRQPFSPAADARKVRLSALFLVVFAITCWLATTDWFMSLQPKWSSTIFGVYQFSGLFVSTLAALIVVAIMLDRGKALPGKLSRKHLHDMGTLLFAFSSFWMYIWFSQYLVIWYTNNPEETDYFVLRQFQPWQSLFYANLALNWAVPFVVLLFRPAKENPLILLSMAVIVLCGHGSTFA